MRNKISFITLLLSFGIILLTPLIVYTHEGHNHNPLAAAKEAVRSDQEPVEYNNSPDEDQGSWIEGIGNLHPILLHFPIALIIMTAISELLYYWYRYPIFDYSARFMLIWAAIFVIPTIITGWLFGWDIEYDDPLISIFWWHRLFGVITALLTIAAVALRESPQIPKAFYYSTLALVVATVTVTGWLGGLMTFGF